jgi:ABC-type uncharacterized transport system auxiliary subunit
MADAMKSGKAHRAVGSAHSIALLMGLAALVVTACALITREAVMYHSFNYPVPTRNRTAPAAGAIMVYRFLMGPSVDTQYLLVSQPAQEKKPVRYHRWSRNPADMITRLIERDLERSGLFEKAIDQASTAPYRYALEGEITDLRGIMTEEQTLAAVDAKVALIDFEAPIGSDKTRLERQYEIRYPCKSSKPADIVAGLNEAVGELSRKLRADIRKQLALGPSNEAEDEKTDTPLPQEAPERTV